MIKTAQEWAVHLHHYGHQGNNKHIANAINELTAKYERAVACLKKIDNTNTACLGCGAIVSHGYSSERAAIIREHEPHD